MAWAVTEQTIAAPSVQAPRQQHACAKGRFRNAGRREVRDAAGFCGDFPAVAYAQAGFLRQRDGPALLRAQAEPTGAALGSGSRRRRQSLAPLRLAPITCGQAAVLGRAVPRGHPLAWGGPAIAALAGTGTSGTPGTIHSNAC